MIFLTRTMHHVGITFSDDVIDGHGSNKLLLKMLWSLKNCGDLGHWNNMVILGALLLVKDYD